VAAASVVKIWMLRAHARQALLDLIDSQIESKWQAEALAGAPHAETEGFAIPGVKMWGRGERLTVKDAVSRLTPEHQRMISDDGPKARAASPEAENETPTVVVRPTDDVTRSKKAPE